MGSALSISKAQFDAVVADNEKIANKLKKAQAATEEKAGLVVTGATIVGVEMTLGYARGRYGEKMIFDLPAEVVGGGALELLAISGMAGKHTEMVANAGHATLGFVGALEMIKLGEEHAAAANKKTLPAAQSTPMKQVVEAPQQPVVAAAGATETRKLDELPDGRRTVVSSVGRTLAEDVAEEPIKKTGT